MTSDNFDSLVHNAIDFLDRSILELEASPKYSVINFCSAVELFLKARLMLEHWTLIIDDPRNAKIAKFRVGDFKSVSMDEAITRLNDIAQVSVDQNTRGAFKTLREHRNKLVHFYHSEYTDTPGTIVLEKVVSEQCQGWFYLRRLLEQWAKEFQNYTQDIARLNNLMLGQRAFLKVKYDKIQEDINEEKSMGISFFACQFCGFEASKSELYVEPLWNLECLVCEKKSHCLFTPCPKCTHYIRVFDLGEGICAHCEAQIDLDFLLDRYDVKQSPKESLMNDVHAYCINCEYTAKPTVVPLVPLDDWLCLFCATLYHFEDVSYCEWCGELVTGDTGSYWQPGCFMCAVHIMREAETD